MGEGAVGVALEEGEKERGSRIIRTVAALRRVGHGLVIDDSERCLPWISTRRWAKRESMTSTARAIAPTSPSTRRRP